MSVADAIALVRQHYSLDPALQGVAHSPLVIAFAAVPGSGKTTLARRLVAETQATRLCRDDIRRVMKRVCPDLSTEDFREVLNGVNKAVYLEVQDTWPNKRIILDSSIDRSYEGTKAYIGADVPLYIIRIIPIWSQLGSRVEGRSDNPEPIGELLHQRWRADWEAFAMNTPADLTWDQAEMTLEDIAVLVQQDVAARFSGRDMPGV